MTLDEAIQHCEEVAEEQEKLYRLCPASESGLYHCDGSKDCITLKNGKNKGCQKCASEHRQLAEWLKELKVYKEQSGDEELDFVPEHKKIPCTLIIGKPCGDAISRKYILDLIDTKGANLDDDLLIVAQWIQDAPSVNPHPIECGDAISRQAVLDIIRLEDKWLLDAKGHNADTEIAFGGMKSKVSDLPSVTPQQRTGRWERMSDLPNDVDDRFQCSRCGNIVHYNNVMNLRTFSRWCGRCGSDNG